MSFLFNSIVNYVRKLAREVWQEGSNAPQDYQDINPEAVFQRMILSLVELFFWVAQLFLYSVGRDSSMRDTFARFLNQVLWALERMTGTEVVPTAA